MPLNIHGLFKLDNGVDMERLAKAMNDTISNYDIFRCRFMFHPDTSDLCQRFDGEIVPVKVEYLSDEEFELRKKTLSEPYKLINAPLYRIYLFEAIMLALAKANDGDYPAVNTLDFEVHAGETGNYSLELAYVTSKYSEAAMQKLAESIDEMLLCLQDDSMVILSLLRQEVSMR